MNEPFDRTKELFTNGKYGYQLNVGNTVLGALHEYYISKHNIRRPMSDHERHTWETQLWRYLQKIFYSCNKKRLVDYPEDGTTLKALVKGYQYEQLFDIINFRLNIGKAINKLYEDEEK